MNYRNFKMLGKFSIPVPAVSSPTQTPWQEGKRRKRERHRERDRDRERKEERVRERRREQDRAKESTGDRREREGERERERKDISSTEPVVSSGLSYHHYVMRESLLQVDFALS